MELAGNYIMAFIETGGYFAPILFIVFHLVRPLLFLPVILFCIVGGLLFGIVAGTIYSIIGITLSSVIFYGMIHRMPKTFSKLVQMKNKIFGKNAELTRPQITLMRLVPFIHFNLLSLCLIEISSHVKEYTKSSFYTSIPFVIVYTSIGQWITNLSPLYIFIFFIALLPFIYLFRKKEAIIKWHDFFQMST